MCRVVFQVKPSVLGRKMRSPRTITSNRCHALATVLAWRTACWIHLSITRPLEQSGKDKIIRIVKEEKRSKYDKVK